MDVNNETVLLELLKNSLSPDNDIRTEAETCLKKREKDINFSTIVLEVVKHKSVPVETRMAAAILFKNFILKNWENVDIDYIGHFNREEIKAVLLDVFLISEASIRMQLGRAIEHISCFDFPSKWKNIIHNVVEMFDTADFHTTNGLLLFLSYLTKVFADDCKSQEEYKLVLSHIEAPLNKILMLSMQLTSLYADKEEALRVVIKSLVNVCELFCLFKSKNIPGFFEDNLGMWMDNFGLILKTDALHTTADNEEAGLLEQLKSQVCDIIAMYVQKYEVQFEQYLPQFVTCVWNLLVTTGLLLPQHDALVSKALQFLAVVADRAHYRSLFEDVNVLTTICEKVLIPNIYVRASDEALFEDNAEEYIRRDIEGSDVDTRRRAAYNLLIVLLKSFQSTITQIFDSYIQVALQNYSENPEENWRDKHAVISLLIYLQSEGQTQICQLVNMASFVTKQLIPELQNDDANTLPVLKAVCLKFMVIFRTSLPPEIVLAAFPHLVQLTASHEKVVHTYAAYAIEKLLMLLSSEGSPIVINIILDPIGHDLICNLLDTLNLESSQDNEYVMKALIKIMTGLRGKAIPFLGNLLPKLTDKLASVARTPRKPYFNHLLCEAISICIRIVCTTDSSAVCLFEEALFPIFQNILQSDIQEFVPYVFQILSLLLEQHKSRVIPKPYMVLFPSLLTQELLKKPGIIPSVLQLQKSYIRQGSTQITHLNLDKLMDFIQKLITSKADYLHGFELLNTAIQYFPKEKLEKFLRSVCRVVCRIYVKKHTTKSLKGLIVFFCQCVNSYGASSLIQLLDDDQPKMFKQAMKKVTFQEVQKISDTIQRKVTVVGITDILCNCPQMLEDGYFQYWKTLLKALISLLELPHGESSLPDEHLVQLEDAAGSTLTFAKSREEDPLSAISDPRQYLAQSLGRLSAACPGRFNALLTTQLSENERAHLKQYFDIANINLS